MAAKAELTKQQRIEHNHVLTVARQNLDIVINQVESMDHQLYDEILEALDNAKQVLEGVHGKTKKAVSESKT